MDTPAKRSAIERAGLSNTKARSLFAGELAKEDKTGGDFRKLTRSEQRGILSRVLGKLRPSAKKPAEEQPVLKQFRYKGPNFMATEKSLAAVNPHFARATSGRTTASAVSWRGSSSRGATTLLRCRSPRMTE